MALTSLASSLVRASEVGGILRGRASACCRTTPARPIKIGSMADLGGIPVETRRQCSRAGGRSESEQGHMSRLGEVGAEDKSAKAGVQKMEDSGRQLFFSKSGFWKAEKQIGLE